MVESVVVVKSVSVKVVVKLVFVSLKEVVFDVETEFLVESYDSSETLDTHDKSISDVNSDIWLSDTVVVISFFFLLDSFSSRFWNNISPELV